jgi:hypothetical protein
VSLPPSGQIRHLQCFTTRHRSCDPSDVDCPPLPCLLSACRPSLRALSRPHRLPHELPPSTPPPVRTSTFPIRCLSTAPSSCHQWTPPTSAHPAPRRPEPRRGHQRAGKAHCQRVPAARGLPCSLGRGGHGPSLVQVGRNGVVNVPRG